MLESFSGHCDKVSAIAALSISPKPRHVGLYFTTETDRYLSNVEMADFAALVSQWLVHFVLERLRICTAITPCEQSIDQKDDTGHQMIEMIAFMSKTVPEKAA